MLERFEEVLEVIFYDVFKVLKLVWISIRV